MRKEITAKQMRDEVVNFVENTDTHTLANIYRETFPDDKLEFDSKLNAWTFETV